MDFRKDKVVSIAILQSTEEIRKYRYVEFEIRVKKSILVRHPIEAPVGYLSLPGSRNCKLIFFNSSASQSLIASKQLLDFGVF